MTTFPFFLFFMEWKISKATMALSVIRQFGMKALWFGEIIGWSVDFSLFAMVFIMTRTTTLQRLIGKKSFRLSGDFTLGIKTM